MKLMLQIVFTLLSIIYGLLFVARDGDEIRMRIMDLVGVSLCIAIVFAATLLL